MKRIVAVLAAAALIAACGSSRHRSAAETGGCTAAGLRSGSVPAWAAHSNPPIGVPYAVGEHRTALAFVFGYPLRAGDPSTPANKILWTVRMPGSGLTIRATPLHSSRPLIIVNVDDNAGAEIYPSHVNVPEPGCWHMSLRWARHTDSVDVPYGPACPASAPGGPRPPRVALQNLGEPMGKPTDPGWYGNGTLWTQLPPGLPGNLADLRTTGADGAGMIRIKLGWNRSRPGPVSITARPLHGPAARFMVHVGTVNEYGATGFVPSTLTFGRAGCWRIIARLGDHDLPIIIDVPSPP